jgi:hypothetical protein
MASAMSPNRSRGGPRPRCRLPTAGRIALVAAAWLTLAASGRASDLGTTDPEAAPSFGNDVVPLLTKAGCNAGACHAKAGTGQNGFRLSLLGFEPGEDHDHLVKEARGRRISVAAPHESLLLLKAAAIVPHGGGKLIETGSPSHEVIMRWIAEGAKPGDPAAPRVVMRAWDGPPLMVPGLEGRLVQVFQNLIANALSFSPPGGEVRLSLQRVAGPDGVRAVVRVEDDGPGIPAGKEEAIFERFYTERPAGEDFGQHSGLGLSISRQIVEALRGRISAENRRDDAGAVIGARFVVRLPKA